MCEQTSESADARASGGASASRGRPRPRRGSWVSGVATATPMSRTSCGGTALADLQIVGREHRRVVRSFGNGDPLGFWIQNVDGAAVHHVVLRVAMRVLFHRDA